MKQQEHENWVSRDIPADIADLLDKCDRLTVLGLDEDDTIRCHSRNLRSTDIIPLFAAFAKLFMSMFHQIYAHSLRSQRMMSSIKDQLVELANVAEGKIIHAAKDQNPEELHAAIIDVLASSIGSMAALQFVTWDPDDPLSGFEMKEREKHEEPSQMEFGFPDADDAGDASAESG